MYRIGLRVYLAAMTLALCSLLARSVALRTQSSRRTAP